MQRGSGLRRGGAVEREGALKSGREAGEPGESRRARVLIIDADARVTQTITRVLCRTHAVAAVDNGTTAFELIDHGARFDVILCDLHTPGMNGDFQRRLGQLLPEVAARIVFLTAGPLSEHASAFLATPGVRFLEKPFRLAELQRVVEDVAGSL